MELGPFLGVVTAVDERLIDDNNASDTRNVILEDGTLQIRSGWQNIEARPSLFSVLYGFSFFSGYDDNRANQREYISIEGHAGPTTRRPYSIHISTGARTEITNGGSSLTLDAGDWEGFTFQGKAYMYPVGGSLHRHSINNNMSWDSLAPANPPTIAPGIVYYSESTLSSGSETGREVVSWSGVDAVNDVQFTSPADPNDSVYSAPAWVQAHTASTLGTAVIRIDFSSYAATKDWPYVTRLLFRMQLPNGLTGSVFRIDPDSIKVRLIQDTPGPFTHESTVSYRVDEANNEYEITADFAWGGRDSTEWALIRYVEFEYGVVNSTGTRADNIINFMPMIVGLLHDDYDWATTTDQLQVAMTYYNPTSGHETDLSPEQTVYYTTLRSKVPRPGYSQDVQMGRILAFTDSTNTPASGYTKSRYYGRDPDGIWRFLVEDDVADTALWIPENQAWSLYDRFFPASQIDDEIMYACPYRNFVVYGTKGGADNIKMSRQGEPLKLASANDAEDDAAAGATITMADNAADEPVWIGHAGSALIFLGKEGAHACTGNTPRTMTPTQKIPNSKGVIGNKAACRWRWQGQIGIAYIATDQELWFVLAREGFNGEYGFELVELSTTVRGLIRSFLTQTASPTLTKLFCFADERGDALWLMYENRAMVMRRPSPVDGNRQWELYEYSGSSVLRVCAAPNLGIRAITTQSGLGGYIDEYEYNVGSNFDSLATDGGAVIEGYWESKKFEGPNRRLDHAMCERSDYAARPTITASSDRQTRSLQYAPGRRHLRFNAFQQGWAHKVRITFTSGRIFRLNISEHKCGRRWNS